MLSRDKLCVQKVNKQFMKTEVFYEIFDSFVLYMCSKLIFCSKIVEKGENSSRLLQPQKITPNAKSSSNVAEHDQDRPTLKYQMSANTY